MAASTHKHHIFIQAVDASAQFFVLAQVAQKSEIYRTNQS
jgi:hypothetical protein